MKKKIMKLNVQISGICVPLLCFVTFACNNSESNKTEKVESIKEANIDYKSKNIENLQSAYKGEVTATAKYKAYADKADLEKYHLIGLLYKAVSFSENIHANNHKQVLSELGKTVPVISPDYMVNTTKENLSNDITGESYEFNTMYPDFLQVAEKAGSQTAVTSLSYAFKTEKKHKVFYEKALGDLNSNTLMTLPAVYFICPTCGNTYENVLPGHCDFCNTLNNKFIKID
jgi:rubrerythrin